MLIALLAVLGVDLIVLVAFIAVVLGRRRWVSHHTGSFPGIALVVDGHVEQMSQRGRRGYGRWVRDVLVWTPAPLFLRNALAAVNSIDGPLAPTGTVRRLGDNPQVITVHADGARIEITVRQEDLGKATAPFPVGPLAAESPTG
jgi:hypothetical protein